MAASAAEPSASADAPTRLMSILFMSDVLLSPQSFARESMARLNSR
jgi:uncharacterized protein YciW